MANNSDWMGSVQKIINPLKLNQLPLPGSHDAGSYGGINLRSQTQAKNITEQLEAGVRFFDFRLRIDNAEYFSHHGSDESRDNPYLHVPWDQIFEQNRNSLFFQIQQFCLQHPSEIVILSLYDFTSVWGQVFNEGDALRLILGLIDCFGSLLIPKSTNGNELPTYEQCMAKKQQVLVIINDHSFPTSADSNQVWQQSQCLRERFSEKGYINWSWEEMVEATITDQQNYLLAATNGGRDPALFWVSQAVLGYNNLTTPDDHSQNYTGSSKLNPQIIASYQNWWHGQDNVLQPNILLMDYSGIHDNFASLCVALLTDNASNPVSHST